MRKRTTLTGEVPSPRSPPSGCRFRARCGKAESICSPQTLILTDRNAGEHSIACPVPEMGAAASQTLVPDLTSLLQAGSRRPEQFHCCRPALRRPATKMGTRPKVGTPSRAS